ncbi:hypothetical protein [Pandoraea oxalativorans]|uniref:Uncharacterized protein n=1 Tax=Pandoraea oxalativorans TaxID=573737 RepID=A0A0G3ID16_9BURK|nr:hypothetical protein [Pandoraea oxalativorans]AKK25112.1 hypothetical protein MB84_30800 [Pandoraea oxalativorans]
MGQVIPIETGKRVHHDRRLRRMAKILARVSPMCVGTARLIGRLLRDTAWVLVACSMSVFGRYIRIALTLTVLVAVVMLGVEYAHHWLHPRNAIVAAVVAIVALCMREAVYRIERRARDYRPRWR